MKPLRAMIAAYSAAYAGLPREIWLLAVYGYVWIFVGDAVTCWAAAAVLLATIRSDAPVGAADRGQTKGRDGTPWRDLPFLGFMVVLTVGEMLSMPITNAVVAERAGAGSVGRYMGVYTLAFSTAFVLGPIVGTAIYQTFGPQTLWYGTGAVGVVLAIAFAALSRPLRTRPLR